MEIHLKLVQAMARVVRGIRNEAMMIDCNGCLLNHPSQIHQSVGRIRFVIVWIEPYYWWIR